MISIHHDAVPGCTPSGGISLAFRYLDCGASPRSPAPLPGQHSRGVAAGLGYLDAEVDALVRMHMLHVEAAR